ncbi:heavy-metal-associated domain-containing protein [Longispora sp. K20-0274]|uniref:heavy-metal-associated domain-containing protein n=1 Tax=Longispora sp. K20-0274 TaxID=3088255 RepID=UPI00399A341C
MTATWTFTVTGMHCASCGLLIDDALEDLDGVTRSATSLRAGRASVEVDPTKVTAQHVTAVIAEAGYTAVWEEA